MGRRWIVVDTNIFCLTDYSKHEQKQNRLFDAAHATDFLLRMVEECEQYGLALDQEGLILEEYEKKIPPDSFGWYALNRMQTMSGKVGFFEHKNLHWIEQLRGCDKHDRRFVATAFATPDKVLVSEDSVFHEHHFLFQQNGMQLYNAEEADKSL